MYVDETWRDDESPGIDFTVSFQLAMAGNRGDPVAAYRNVALIPRIARTIDDRSIANEQIVFFGTRCGPGCDANRYGQQPAKNQRDS